MAEDKQELRYLEEPLYPMQSHHMKEIEGYFSLRSPEGVSILKHSIDGATPVFICFTNRVGSNLLTALLEQAKFGVRVAEEDFNSSKVLAVSKNHGLKDFSSYLGHICREIRQNDTIFLKIGAAQLLWLSNRGFIADFFPTAKFLFIRRRDKLAQAVSLYMMNRTGQYLADIPANTDNVDFKPIEIARELKWIVDNERLFEYFFALHSVTPLQIWYEDLVSSPQEALNAIVRHCGISADDCEAIAFSPEKASVRRQYSTLNDQFIQDMKRRFSLSDG